MLTNIVNFYDGADLNLATFIALTAAGRLTSGPIIFRRLARNGSRKWVRPPR